MTFLWTDLEILDLDVDGAFLKSFAWISEGS